MIDKNPKAVDLRRINIPASRHPVTLLAVERAIAELRRGGRVVIRGNNGAAVLAQAAEGVTEKALAQFAAITLSAAALSVTARRASILGLAEAAHGRAVSIVSEPALSAETIDAIANPLTEPSETLDANLDIKVRETTAYDSESAAVTLTKIARLLPAAITAPINDPKADDLAAWSLRHDLILVDSGDIFQYQQTAARTLRQVSEARVPLANAENTRILAFRPTDGGLEHLAILVGQPDPETPVLTRIHSECFTGDILASLRCDCGDQLRGAITEISTAGSGVLLYLAQEGRGIGLVNKLRAYELQDRGYDTIDANEQLGFDADERVYLPAAQILLHLGFASVKLMTNNPHKAAALVACGVTVAERVAHTFPSNEHNKAYLQTKAWRSGHMF